MKIIVLGSGTSHGVPVIGCNCPTCRSTNPKDKRLRVSVYIVSDPDPFTGKTQKLLIDTSPDFRQQMLTNHLNDIDAVMYTHHHIDHIMGLDDIFIINLLQKKTVEIYGNEETISQIKITFRYIFDEKTFKGGGIPDVHCNIIGLEKFSIGHVEITPIEYFHGSAIVYGYRIGDFAYITDCSKIPEKEFPKLGGLKLLIIDALRYRPHPTHYSIDQATEISKRINAKQTYFTHITHDVLHDEANSKLPANIQLAYDGLTVDL